MKRKLINRVRSFNEDLLPAKYIYSAKSMVKYSFVVQRSITYLDLSLCEYSKSKRTKKRHKYASFQMKNAVYTEEACKKKLAPNRTLLYDFHLDVSKELDVSLRNPEHQEIRYCCSERVLLNMINFKSHMHDSCLNRIIVEVLEETNQKVKLIQTVSKMVRRMNFISKNECIRTKGLAYLCFQCADSNIIKDFLIAMGFKGDYFFNLSIHIFERVLYHSYRTGYNLWSQPPYLDPIHSSIRYAMFVKTESLFQYYSAPRFCEKGYNSIKLGHRSGLSNSLGVPEEMLHIPVRNGLITRERHFLILEIILVFLSERMGGLKALQMLWRSIPEPYITLVELTSVLWGVQNPKFIDVIINFTKQIIGEDVIKDCQPRKLKHYCRTTIRNNLNNNNNNQFLSAKIDELKLPSLIESFLKLQD